MLNVSGIYIQFPGAKGKCEALLNLKGVEEVTLNDVRDHGFVHANEFLAVVVDNGPFEACGTITNERDYSDFTRYDGRFKRWFLVPKTLFPDTFKPSMYAEGRNGQ